MAMKEMAARQHKNQRTFYDFMILKRGGVGRVVSLFH